MLVIFTILNLKFFTIFLDLFDRSNEVILLERNDKCGKKILLTGNGRCNYWNSDISSLKYHTDNFENLSTITNNIPNNFSNDENN